jgi:hypothetical protein
MSDLSGAIEQIWKKYPKALDSGATSEYLASVVCELPYQLPQEVCELYFIADGLGDYILFWAGRFLCLSEAVDTYKKLREYRNFDISWFPIMENEGWLYFIVGSSQQQQTSHVYKIDGADLMSSHDVEPYLEYSNLTEMIRASITELGS